MSKKVIIIFLLGISFLIAFWLISPLFIDKEVNESLTDILGENEDLEVISKGDFVGLDNHRATGTATLLKSNENYFIRFEDDFDITNGPDLFVDLGKSGQHDSEARLGKLKGSIGSQNYKIPTDLNIDEYNEVWVWCRAFSVPFGKVTFK